MTATVLLPSGHLRQVVTIQSPTAVDNPDGTFSKTWTDVGWRAKVEPLRGSEFFEGQQMTAVADTKVTMRYYAGLTPKDRFVLNGRVLNIVAIRNLEERNIVHEVLCKEAV